MEFKLNVDVDALAKQMVLDMTANLHASMKSFVQYKFGLMNPVPNFFSGFRPNHPSKFGPGPRNPLDQEGVSSFGQPRVFPNPPEMMVVNGMLGGMMPDYYNPMMFTGYSGLMNKLSTDETLIKTVEEIIAVHVQEFLNNRMAEAPVPV